MSDRDKRALKLLAGAVAVYLLLQFGLPAPSGGESVAATASGAPLAALEEQLKTAQAEVSRKPLGDAELAYAERLLAAREKRLLDSADPALAQAEMRAIVGEILTAEGIVLNSSRFPAVELEGIDYARTAIDVTITCAIEQALNFLTAVANHERLLTTRRIRIRPEKQDIKSVRVEMQLAGYLPIERAPELADEREAAIARAAEESQ